MKYSTLALCVAVIVSLSPCAWAGSLYDDAQAILKTNCAPCHGGAGHAEGNFDYVLNPAKLASEGLVIPGDPDNSELFQRAGILKDMPPKPRRKLSDDEAGLLAQWIKQWPTVPPPKPGTAIPDGTALTEITQDLQAIPSRFQRKNTRYLSLIPIYNTLQTNGTDPAERDRQLALYRKGISKLVNSLSWMPKLVDPVAIDNEKTLFRINLNDYGWDSAQWEKIVAANPFARVLQTPAWEYVYSATETLQPVVHADWFSSVAAVPPLYDTILRLPDTDIALEGGLGIDVNDDIRRGIAQRAGILSSGVALHNRILERHPLPGNQGAYWKSYDFASNQGQENILAFPLGPSGFLEDFKPAAGEIIWNLPNGLQAYYLIQVKNGIGQRLDTALQALVIDPLRPDKAVVNGLSCMSCHDKGMQDYKHDIVRDHVKATRPDLFPSVSALYPEDGILQKTLAADSARFQKSLQTLNIQVASDSEPVNFLEQNFEVPVDISRLAFEQEVTQADLKAAILRSEALGRSLGILLNQGGSVTRQTLAEQFSALSSELSRSP